MTARDRLVAIVVVALAVLAAFWFLLVAPKRAQVSTLQGQITTQQQALATAQSTVNTNTAARIAYNHDYATIVRLGKAVPTDPEVASLLVQLQAAALHSKVDFRSLDSGGATNGTQTPPAATTATTGTTATDATPVVAAPAITNVPFTLGFQGSYFGLARFLQTVQNFTSIDKKKNIEVNGRLLTISTITLGASPKGFPQIKATISATAYQLPAAATATTTATTTTTPASTTTPAASTSGSTPATATPAATAGTP
jgi:Tfp pilus assembly protein PilO